MGRGFHDIHFLMDVLSLQCRLAAAQIFLQGRRGKKGAQFSPDPMALQAPLERITEARYCRVCAAVIIHSFCG